MQLLQQLTVCLLCFTHIVEDLTGKLQDTKTIVAGTTEPMLLTVQQAHGRGADVIHLAFGVFHLCVTMWVDVDFFFYLFNAQSEENKCII